MVGASKILTVSYGTFSCTLEGFDDSFSTMKAIAEYFRDLAADDRYFGAEPPTPDAEMLARIAEREIERRVEARFDGENVVLRAAQTAPAAVALSRNAGDDAGETEQTDATATDVPETATETETEITKADADTAAAPAIAEPDQTVAPAPVAQADIETTAEIEEDAIAAFMTTEPSTEAFEDDSPEEDSLEDVGVAQTPVAARAPTPVSHPDADSIAAKLQRIRAVVAPGDDNADSIFVEDQHAEPMPDMLNLPEDQVADTETADVTDEPALIAEAPQGADASVSDGATDDEPDDETDDAEDADDLDMTAFMSSLAEQDAPAAKAQADAQAPDETADIDLSGIVDAELAEEEPAPAGRVFKVKSEALEAALRDQQADDDDADDTADDIESSIFEDDDSDSDLSPEEEAELMAELAEVARDTEAEASQDRAGAAILASLDDNEPAIDRILEKTKDALDEPESGRKREAISHLKAAVAATEADRKMGTGHDASTDQTESYRDDLAQVVRPKRATPAEGAPRVRPQRPTAPLKLVAEQRVDAPLEAAAPAEPVRPRRISKTATPETEGGFAEFAQNAGANALPDLLEAAAAYTSYVEGRENFTRPQVMRRAAAVAGKEGFSREDGLRSFGQLLREGKINKLSRGQFVVSEETRFRPNARIAGE